MLRLDKVFGLIDVAPRGKKCEAIEGIIEEGAEIMKEFKGAPALDAGLVSSAQAVEHYEIARYGTLKRWAEQMGLDEAVACSTRRWRRRRTPTKRSPSSPTPRSTNRPRRRNNAGAWNRCVSKTAPGVSTNAGRFFRAMPSRPARHSA